MDKQFLEFLGKMLEMSTQGQQSMEEIGKWCAGSFEASKSITSLWSRMYGLPGTPDMSSGTAGQWQDAMDGFRRSYAEFMAMLDLVPRTDYDAVVRENESLKKTVQEQEEQMAHLRALLAGKFTNPVEGLESVQNLMNEQAQFYQSFMQSMASVFQKPSEDAPEAAPAPARKKARPKK